jgi:hypothetical protein
MRRMLATATVVVLGFPVPSGAASILPTFSIDPASPSIAGSVTPDDVLRNGRSVFIPGLSLGLLDAFALGIFDNLDALSYGQDPIRNPLYFSVDRVAVGLPFTAVHEQSAPGVESAAGDVYRAARGNALFVNEAKLGLVPGFFGDDLDALDFNRSPGPVAFFSIDSLSANDTFVGGLLSDDILVSTGTGSFGIYCDGVADIGLSPGDDLDALVFDAAMNVALFSLSSFSPSTFTSSGNNYVPGAKGFLSPADVLVTGCDGTFDLWAPAAALGLNADDELDALDTFAPVPEPALLHLVALGVLAVAGYRQRLKTRTRQRMRVRTI